MNYLARASAAASASLRAWTKALITIDPARERQVLIASGGFCAPVDWYGAPNQPLTRYRGSRYYGVRDDDG